MTSEFDYLKEAKFQEPLSEEDLDAVLRELEKLDPKKRKELAAALEAEIDQQLQSNAAVQFGLRLGLAVLSRV